MYTPDQFATSDAEALVIVEQNPFGMLIHYVDGSPMITHLPFLLESGRLLGHVANANPHSQHLDGKAVAVFRGAHAYVSPRWYGSEPNVPTWNYQAVQIEGACRPLTDEPNRRTAMDDLVERFEQGAWRVDWDDPVHRRLLGAVTFFELKIERIRGKSKMSQNRSPDERRRVAAALTAQTARGSAIAELIAAVDADDRTARD